MLTLKNINKSYRIGNKNQEVLKDITLNFDDQGFVSILGPSGCGKTTLLNLIGGLDKPNKGDILYNGENINDFSSKDLDAYRNSTIGFVFQGIYLISHLNVYQNVEMALQLSGISIRKRKDKVLNALKLVGLEHMIHKKPSQLSGGEQQRVAIARAIVNEPTIILADEPTGSLDSNTSNEVIKTLKEISKSHLVIMVTHNEKIALENSTRIIRMLDGNIEYDNKKIAEVIEEKKYKKNKVRMPVFMSFSLSIRNLCAKWIRSILTAFAGSIGIIGVALVLAVSSGVKEYINEVQTEALNNYPVIIRSSTVVSSSGSVYNNREEFPDNNSLLVTNSITNYQHISNLDDNFISYINQLDSDKYTLINYNRSINMKLLTKRNENVESVSLSYFNEMINSNDFMKTQYDVIYGTMPTKYNELALVIDSYNSISASTLSSLGLDYQKETYGFDEIIGKEYRLVNNNDRFYYDETQGRFYTYGSSFYDTQYQNGDNLVITAILRENPNCSYPLYSNGILYTPALTDYILNNANESDIVKKQKEYGTAKNVMSGNPYKESGSLSYTSSIEYQYESDLIYYSAVATITSVNIYSQTFENRNYIESYIKDYSNYNTMQNVSYYDYMSSLSKDFATFIEILTKVLVVFALISLLVSTIMISIITYISVLERNKEIGLLRSLGARKIDITQVFCAETTVIGFFSGIFGVILSFVLKMPINHLVDNIIKENLPLYSRADSLAFVQFDPLIMILLIVGSIVITVIAGLIPAIIASFKQPAKVLKSE